MEDPAYRHVLLNHLPVTGLLIAWLVLAIGVLSRQSSSLYGGLGLVALTAGSAVPVVRAGNEAYPFVFGKLDGDGQAWLDHHTYLADTWSVVLYVNAVLAATAIGVGLWRRKLLWRSAAVVTVTTAASLVAVVAIADAGGKIKHPEFRLTYPPVHDDSPRPKQEPHS